jgi:putative membrane protein
MKTIWTIFLQDLRKIRSNVIALVVVMGITVLPCLYAWFNIAASWNPYGNTGNLKVAVASMDAGYDGTLIPIHLNIGDQVLSALRANTQLDWIFTNEEKAIEGVKSGEYYAAIVIPKDFSANMMSIFSSDVQKAEIQYYANDKENAIAPKVTDKGATGIQKQINEIFIQTAADAVLTAFQTVSNLADETGDGELTANLIRNLDQISSDLYASANTLHSFSLMTASIQQLLDMTSTFLEESQSRSQSSLSDMEQATNSLSSLQTLVQDTTAELNDALNAGQDFYDQVEDILTPVFNDASDQAESVASTLTTLSSKMNSLISLYQSIQKAVTYVGTTYPKLAPMANDINQDLSQAIADQKALEALLDSTADAIQTADDDLQNVWSDFNDLDGEIYQNVSSLQEDYKTEVQPKLEHLFRSLGVATKDIDTMLTDLDKSLSSINALTDSGSSDLSQLQSTLDETYAQLDHAASTIQSLSHRLTNLQKEQDFSLIQTILSDDPDAVSAFFAAPVTLDTIALYPVENYGSAMAPFYSTLAIWVGAIVLVAMIKVNLSEERKAQLPNVQPHQMYFGRYLLFLLLGLLQSSLICLGDLYYLGIQCKYPLLFLLTGWVSSIVYGNIVYTLTVSFGDVGKAVSIVLLVMQVAGTGGTFPIQVAPALFQAVYPLLPFTHSMEAMRECIGGMYGMTYWIELGKLAFFLVPSLILGLLLRKPVIRFNAMFTEQLEDTKLI